MTKRERARVRALSFGIILIGICNRIAYFCALCQAATNQAL